MSGFFTVLSTVWRNRWTGWVGFRYLKSKKNSRFLSFITIISMMGVGLGVAAMIIVLSVMDGFEAELKKRLMTSDLHVLISPKPEVAGYDGGFVPKTALDGTEVATLVRGDPQVVSFEPTLTAEAILRSGRKVSGIVLKGVTAERMARLKTQITESAEPQMLVERDGADTRRLPGLFLGKELAYELNLIPGDHVTLISPTEMEGPMAAVPRLKRYVIEGIYHSGLPEQELQTVFASEGAVRSFLRRQDVVTTWEIAVKDFDYAPRLAARIAQAAPQFRVQHWIELNAHLFYSLKLERIAMFIMMVFIVIVASFNIVTTLTLMVLEKKREISILRAMGARAAEVSAIFLSEGLFIGVLGVVGGTIFGFVACAIIKRYPIIELPEVYYDRTLPVTFDGFYYLIVALAAAAIVLLACLYPSQRASKLNPLDGIRFG